MNQDRLRAWLNLPDGPWPPDFYTLIGMKPGAGDTAELEARILERLERLRQYQLAHPDEATAGMSLLAQAFDCLTSPTARQAYDQKLGIQPRAVVTPLRTVDDVVKSVFADIPKLVPADESSEIPLAQLPIADIIDEVESTQLIDDEPLLLEPILEPLPILELLPVVVPPPLPKRKRTAIASEPAELPEAILLPVEPPELSKRQAPPQSARERKRQLYADAVRLRRVLMVCNRAYPYFTNHEHSFSKPDDAVGLMACLAELRVLLPTVDDLIGKATQPGYLLATIARQRLMIGTFRNLLPSQRERLAKDFRSAHYLLEESYRDVRAVLRARTRKGFMREYLVPVQRLYTKYPEVYILPLALLALSVAYVRS